jgi:hypothetical protein
MPPTDDVNAPKLTEENIWDEVDAEEAREREADEEEAWARHDAALKGARRSR